MPWASRDPRRGIWAFLASGHRLQEKFPYFRQKSDALFSSLTALSMMGLYISTLKYALGLGVIQLSTVHTLR